MRKYVRIYRSILKNFGFTLRPLGTFSALQVRNGLHVLTRGLDHIFYPKFRRLPIRCPIFILGNPRSGTTFMHRFLLNTDELCAFELWEMLFPAITARKLLGGFVGQLAPFNPAQYHSSEAHQTSLRDVETDDAAAFLHFLDGGFYWAYYRAWDDTFGSPECMSYLDPTAESAHAKERLFGYLEGCWRRNMYARKRPRIVVKSSLFTLRAEELVRRYPDCRLIYMVRDPVSTIPSGISLITGVLENAYDMYNSVEKKRLAHYLENLYQAGCHLYRSFWEAHQRNAIPTENLRIIPYSRIMTRLEETMEELVDFTGLHPSPEFQEKVKLQADKQRNHRTAHAYSLEKYNLTEERIRKDLAFVYDTYGI
jgi:omega-hydroxy-beta-dihydromenaquinone-9 sulfotransferase